MERNTLAVAIPNTYGLKPTIEAVASAWSVGGYPILDHATRIVAHVQGSKIVEYVSKSGGTINSWVKGKYRFFDPEDMIEATPAYPNDMTPLVGKGRGSRVRWLA